MAFDVAAVALAATQRAAQDMLDNKNELLLVLDLMKARRWNARTPRCDMERYLAACRKPTTPLRRLGVMVQRAGAITAAAGREPGEIRLNLVGKKSRGASHAWVCGCATI